MLDDFSDRFPPYGDETAYQSLKNEFEKRFGKQDFSKWGLKEYSIQNYGKLYEAIEKNLSKTTPSRIASTIISKSEEDVLKASKFISSDKIASAFMDKGFLKNWKAMIQEDDRGFYMANCKIGKISMEWNEIVKTLSEIKEFRELGNTDKERAFLKTFPQKTGTFSFKIPVEGSKNWSRNHRPFLQGNGFLQRRGMDLYFKHEPIDGLLKEKT
ncbi:MAG: hypothetical protein M0P12_00385 [Paludibacteraceae bacterium]|nr:hypothetical protein [Paludibacteraceae bacterium]